jgi:hypothetical protein
MSCQLCYLKEKATYLTCCKHEFCKTCCQLIYDEYEEQRCPICNEDISIYLSENFKYSKNAVNKYKEISLHLISDLQKSIQMLKKYRYITSNQYIDHEISLLEHRYKNLHFFNVSDFCYYPLNSNHCRIKYNEMFEGI